MLKSKFFLLICLFNILFLSCDTRNSLYKKKLRIGTGKNYPCSIFHLEVLKTRINFDYKLVSGDEKEIIHDFNENELDLICAPYADILLTNAEKESVPILYILGEDPENDVFVSKKTIKSISELSGLKISFSSLNSSSYLFTLKILENNHLISSGGLKEGEFDAELIDYEYVPEKILSGEISAGHTQMDKIENPLDFNILGKSEDLPDYLISVLGAREAKKNIYRKEIQSILREISILAEEIKENPSRYSKEISAHLGKPPEDFEGLIRKENLHFYTLEKNLTLLNELANSEEENEKSPEHSPHHPMPGTQHFFHKSGSTIVSSGVEILDFFFQPGTNYKKT